MKLSLFIVGVSLVLSQNSYSANKENPTWKLAQEDCNSFVRGRLFTDTFQTLKSLQPTPEFKTIGRAFDWVNSSAKAGQRVADEMRARVVVPSNPQVQLLLALDFDVLGDIQPPGFLSSVYYYAHYFSSSDELKAQVADLTKAIGSCVETMQKVTESCDRDFPLDPK